MVNGKFLDLLGIEVPGAELLEPKRFRRLASIRDSKLELLVGSPDMDSIQVDYLEHRLGSGLTLSDYERLRIVWNVDMLKPYISTERTKNTLPSNMDSISFLSDDRSMMMTRFFDPGRGPRWKKTKLFPSDNRGYYTVASTLDLFTGETLTVHLSEGIFDTISAYKNFNTGDNSVYLAFLGKDYNSGFDYLLAKGIFGSNVEVRVYADSDVNRKLLRSQLRKYRWIFGSVTIAWNVSGEDFGLLPDRIKLGEIKV